MGNMDSEIATQIRECEARLYTAMSASDVFGWSSSTW